ncbi:MAG TPA: chemotaxis protein CheA [Bradyrhizobium sp.]|nr:chemotaxis protein CheA [Bradyrhizobium sp.]
MNEFVEQFLLESRELVAQATDDLMALEDRPADKERLDGVFRAFHTLKGAAGIVEFAAMSRTLHAAEDILSALRASRQPISSNVLGECLACLDLTSRWLDAMQASGETPSAADRDADDMIARLVGAMTTDEDDKSPARTAAARDDWLDRLPAAASPSSGALTAIRYVPDPDAFFRGEDPLSIIASLPQLLAVELALTDQTLTPETIDTFNCSLEILALTKAPTAEVQSALRSIAERTDIRPLAPSAASPDSDDDLAQATSLLEAQIALLRVDGADGLSGRLESAGRTAANALLYLGRSGLAAAVEQAMTTSRSQRNAASLIAAIEQALTPEAEPPPAPGTAVPVASRALRVDMDRIDALVKLTGELIVVKNAIGHAAKRIAGDEDPAAIASILRDQHALFDRLANELQGAVLRIRVLPLRTVFRRFPRLVREIAGNVGKSIRLITEGEATEADATIVDALFEPLLHVLRNAVDHGIETPEQRASAGKPAMGTIVLHGRREADTVRIEIEDDGGGIDVDRVRAVAAAHGLASEQALAAMTEAEAVELIFAPGFSTAATVSDLSGRGVGMDSVRAAVERLGGTVTLRSRAGTGTTVTLSLPFSLMMTRVMTVEVAGQAFGLPLDTVLETTIVARDMIVPIGSGRAFVLRDRTIPLVDLADTLGLARDASSREAAKVVVVSAAGQIGGLEVDRLGERLDVMLKPMEGLLGCMTSVAGTTLLGDGRILVVLDVQEMFG